eukprot:4418233-Prymnesium_polylepis.1
MCAADCSRCSECGSAVIGTACSRRAAPDRCLSSALEATTCISSCAILCELDCWIKTSGEASTVRK